MSEEHKTYLVQQIMIGKGGHGYRGWQRKFEAVSEKSYMECTR